MPRLVHKPPKYSKHKASGQAVVTIAGRDIYLGDYGTKESRQEYDRVVAEWLAADCTTPKAARALSGAFLAALGCPLFTPEAREMLGLHPLLRRGDVLVADRAFCSYAQLALLMRHGVDRTREQADRVRAPEPR